MDSEIQLLVEAAQNGRLESFGALYERYYSSMVALAYSILADKQLAEDAAQESFAVACSKLSKLKNTDKFAAWLAGICRNTARKMLRAKVRQSALKIEPAKKDGSYSDRHQLDKVQQAVGKLKQNERELIMLRYYDNLPYERIAAVLNISIQAVNGRLIRAKRKIAQYLKRNGITGDDYVRAPK